MQTLTVPHEMLAAMIAHAEETYPHECCGLFAGDRQARRVDTVHRAANLNQERARDRYELDPQDFLAFDRALRGTGREILGVYHSHPDHPAIASETDRSRAWPDYSYIIVSVQGGRVADVKSWVYDLDSERFFAENFTLEPAPGSAS
ncbi:MAG: M67 family metallopeptidase [Candidatus Schekmanbacteria bacterium]|nr:M67 family metallopeptidase [Candidatus Schekmanbacteria bacterium]